ncbi:replication protein A 70 kDa DNA-binding subunit [Toxorhynchites rutilus septentrionalis]|uniref:replication protein A 70 kDa DNA-binding subunit n=1 Tax=Toxorhynchites rutilus septentrionalis TaxID=329112 RepID=UPI0024793628|nr:replication protein A 70 kDa DNA-binding subunit [Toxorhynchites rutilus septentrionalis]XP_055631008.1 replication protein A 70 kDa DNA-binding subunit [Toxorhynchites rutilus septentrionalis]
MAYNSLLTKGCIGDIMRGSELDKPVVQILGSKRIAGGGEQSERYRLLISDGQNLYSFAMLATQLNELHQTGKLSEFTVIRIDRYITSVVNRNERGEKRVLIMLELTVIKTGESIGEKIGNPQPLSDNISAGGGSSGSTASAGAKAETNGSISNGSAYQNRTNSANTSSSAGNMSLHDHLTHPISSLSPYQNKWVIKARVMSKSAIRSWSNAKGEGKLFSMDLMDESGEIRVTAFKEQCDKFYDVIEVDKVYYITKCQLKPANKQYSTLKNDYEMTMTNDTVIHECKDVSSMPEIQYNFVPISQIANMEPNCMLDVIGVCKEAGEIMQFTAKSSGRELKKREITMVDSSNAAVQLTLWGEDAQTFPASTNPVILVKGARVTEFGGGKSIGLVGGSVMKLNPDIEVAHKMRGWYDNGGCESVVASVSTRTGAGTSYATEWMTFHESKERNLGDGDKPDYFQVKALVHNIKSGSAVYKACPQQDCNKKVIDQDNGQYRCEKCNAEFPTFKYRLLVNMLIGDWTSNRWITVFTDLAEQMLGKSSQEIGESLEYNKEEAEKIFSTISFKSFIFKLRTKVETYGDQRRNKTTAVAATPVRHQEYNAYLIKNIQTLTGIGKN